MQSSSSHELCVGEGLVSDSDSDQGPEVQISPKVDNCILLLVFFNTEVYC